MKSHVKSALLAAAFFVAAASSFAQSAPKGNSHGAAGFANCGAPDSLACQSQRQYAAQKAEAEKYCTKKQSCVPIAGKTTDGKYPVYKLDGDPGDLKYFSGNTAYQPSDLVGRMGFVEETDTKVRGVTCDWICVNGAKQVIGLDPSVKASMAAAAAGVPKKK